MGFSASIGVNIASAIMAAAPVSAVFHILLIVPCITIDNAMACRVFRSMALRYMQESSDNRNRAVFTTAIFSWDMDNIAKLNGEENTCGDVELASSERSQRV